ncbi:hypothetical protein N7491_010595, partial [Penicillium cf. griseofulvum]
TTMRYLNNLPADAIEGTIDGITIRWSNNGNFNLPGNASKFKIDPGDMKRATEHVAHACAKRLGKTEVRLYLFVWLGIRIGTTGENAYLPRWLHDLVVRFQPSSTFLRDATMTAHPLALLPTPLRTRSGQRVVIWRRRWTKWSDSAVYGMASNGSVFWFLKISNDSKWSEHVVTARDNHFEHPLGLLVHIFRRADLISPTHSKESSIQSYDREETNGAAGALAIDEDVEIQAALTSQKFVFRLIYHTACYT